MRQLGSWYIFIDISGQVSESPNNPLQTVAAVAIPTELERQARGRLIRTFESAPVKWKKGRLPGWAKIADLIRTMQLPVAVLHVHTDRPQVWSGYFAGARQLQAEAAPRVQGRRMPYLDGGTSLRMLLFSRALARIAGHLLRTRRSPLDQTPASVEYRLVVDTDIPDEESRRFFEASTEEWGSKSELIEVFSVYPRVTARCHTEQDEALLNLPDYVAGLFQHADPRAVLGSPVVSRDDARSAIVEFQARHKLLIVESEEFREPYPLLHDSLGDVQIQMRPPDSDGRVGRGRTE